MADTTELVERLRQLVDRLDAEQLHSLAAELDGLVDEVEVALR